MDDWVSVREEQAKGDGNTDDTAAIRQSLRKAAQSGNEGSGARFAGLYFPPGTYRIAADLAFPETMTLQFADGAMLAPDAGVTVTVRSRIGAGLYPIFGGEGRIAGPLRVPEVFPQWFGASGSAASLVGSMDANANVLALREALDFRNGQYAAVPGARACRAAAPDGLQSQVVGNAGSAEYVYTVAAVDDAGGLSSAAAIRVGNGPASLSPDDAVALSWKAATGASAYWIYGRSDREQRRLAQVSGTSWTDTGAAPRASEPVLPASLPAPGTLIARIVGGGGTAKLTLSEPSAFRVTAFVRHDDTFAVRRALDSCGYDGQVAFPRGVYRISDTIACRAARLSGKGLAELQFGPLASYDLKPCLDIRDANTSVDHLSVSGASESYSLDDPGWVDARLFAGQYYDMFVHGAAGFRISGSARPVFRKIKTLSNLKCGVLLDNRTGHVSLCESLIGGMIGVYCRTNAADYYFESCNLTGTFCGVLFGVIPVSGHSGGFGAQMDRVHMGFAPFSFYQTIDDPAVYRSAIQVLGMECILTTVQHEQIGEAAFKLLPKSVSKLQVIGGFGLSWSRHTYTKPRTGWQFAAPDEWIAENLRQQYAAWFGTLSYSDIPTGAVTGSLFMSSSPGALGSAKIERLAATSNLDGLSPDYASIASKEPSALRTYSLSENLARRTQRSRMPISRGNLLRNPEDPKAYRVYGGELETVSAENAPLSASLIAELGQRPVLLRFTPDRNAKVRNLQLDFSARPYPSSELPLSMSLWAFTESAGGVHARLSAQAPSGAFVDYYLQTLYPRGRWAKIAGEEGTPTASEASVLYQYLSIALPGDRPTLLCGMMVSEGALTAYAPRGHLSADTDLELVRPGNALILTSPGGARFALTVDDQGKLAVRPVF